MKQSTPCMSCWLLSKIIAWYLWWKRILNQFTVTLVKGSVLFEWGMQFNYVSNILRICMCVYMCRCRSATQYLLLLLVATIYTCIPPLPVFRYASSCNCRFHSLQEDRVLNESEFTLPDIKNDDGQWHWKLLWMHKKMKWW